MDQEVCQKVMSIFVFKLTIIIFLIYEDLIKTVCSVKIYE